MFKAARKLVSWLLVVSILLDPSTGFLQHKPTRCRSSTPWFSLRPQAPKKRTDIIRAYMSNNTAVEEGNGDRNINPLQPFLEFWASSAGTSSAYRTFLFTGALFGSRSIRDFLGLPGCFLFASAVFFVYYYETKFNYLVDIVTPKRQAALKAVRQFKTDQLSSSSSSMSNSSISDLLHAYEKSLRDELEARIIIPPTLCIIEMDASQEDRTAAPALLGLEITDKYTLEPIDKQV